MKIFYTNDKNVLDYVLHTYKQDTNYKEIFYTNLNDMINEINSMSLFGGENDKKLFISNADFLMKSKNNIKNTNEIAEIIQSNAIDVFFVLFDKKSEFLEINGVDIEGNATKINKTEIMKKLFGKKDLVFKDNDTKNLLISQLSTHESLFDVENELIKLSLLNEVIDEKKIKSISDTNYENVFLLLEYLLDRKKDKVIELYDGLISKKIQIISLINILSTQLLNLKLLKILENKKISKYEIMNALQLTNFTYATLYKKSTKIQSDQLNTLIDSLYQLEYNIISGIIEQYYGFKVFLIEYGS